MERAEPAEPGGASRARDFGQSDVIVVGLGIYAVLGLVSDIAVRALERWALRYRSSFGG